MRGLIRNFLIVFVVFLEDVSGHVANISFNLTSREFTNNSMIENFHTILLNDNIFSFPVSMKNMITFEGSHKWTDTKYIIKTKHMFSLSFENTVYNLPADYFYGYSGRTSLCNKLHSVMESQIDDILNDLFNCTRKVTGFVGRFFIMEIKKGESYRPVPNMGIQTIQNWTGLLVIGHKHKLMFNNIVNQKMFAHECYQDQVSLRAYVFIGICAAVMITSEISICIISLSSCRGNKVHPSDGVRLQHGLDVELLSKL